MRPKNWQNLYRNDRRYVPLTTPGLRKETSDYEIREEAADDILEALKQQGKYKTPCEELQLCNEWAVIKTQVSGWLIFIEDEEVKDES